MDFTTPGTPSAKKDGPHFNLRDYDGKLLLFQPSKYLAEVKLKDGSVAPAVATTVTELEGATPGKIWDDVLVFSKGIIPQLRDQIGLNVLGRVGQGEAQPGKSAPWRLRDATQADIATALRVTEGTPAPGTTADDPP